MSSFAVVLDACVLVPASLRDTLLRAASLDLYRMQLTDDILEEVFRNLIKKGMPEDKAKHLEAAVRDHFGDAFVTHHRSFIGSMPNHEKDRHVLAAAVASNAQIIVTQNLKDFPRDLLAPFGVAAQSPDEFLIHLFHLDQECVAEILVQQAGNLRKPPMTVPELLDTLKLHAPRFVDLVRKTVGFQSTYPWSSPAEIESDL